MFSLKISLYSGSAISTQIIGHSCENRELILVKNYNSSIEGILATSCATELLLDGAVQLNDIPELRESVKNLFDATNIRLPKYQRPT